MSIDKVGRLDKLREAVDAVEERGMEGKRSHRSN